MTDQWAVEHARTTDPDTSHEAARRISKPRAGTIRAKLLSQFAQSFPYGLTGELAATMAGYGPGDGAWRRVSDLIRDALLEDTGQRVDGWHGRPVRVLRITEAGRELAR